MDFGTIIGTLGGLVLIFFAIITGSEQGISTFVNIPYIDLSIQTAEWRAGRITAVWNYCIQDRM